MFRYILLSILLFSGLFGTDIYYDQVIDNGSWEPKAKIRLIENNDTTYSIAPNMADGLGNPITSIDGNLDIGNFYLKVAKDEVTGHSIIHKFGRNPAVSTSSFSTIWNGGGAYTGFNATEAEIVTISSTDADDNGDTNDTGLRTLRIFGLDADWHEQYEDITLEGTDDVNSTLSYVRLDRAKGLTAGSSGYNEGDITIKQSVTIANVFAVVPATYNSTMIAAYTIPADRTGYLMSLSTALSNKNAAVVDVRFQVKHPGDIFTVGGEAAINSVGSGFVTFPFPIPIRLQAKTDIYIEGEASASVAVSAFMDILLVDD